MRDEALDAFVPVIENIAKSFAYKYRVDEDDIRQTMLLWWLSKRARLAPYLDDEDTERGKAHVINTLRNVASDFCRKEIAHNANAYPDDVFLYSKKHIKSLLPFVETPERWTGFARASQDGGEGRAKGDPATQGDALAAYADLRAAWSSLGESDRDVLRGRFTPSGEVPYSVLADDSGEDEAIVRKRIDRAVGRMQRYLGGSRRRVRRAGGAVDFEDAVFPRRSVSNAHAQAVTGRDWSGD